MGVKLERVRHLRARRNGLWLQSGANARTLCACRQGVLERSTTEGALP